jgi:hypothetical protein
MLHNFFLFAEIKNCCCGKESSPREKEKRKKKIKEKKGKSVARNDW